MDFYCTRCDLVVLKGNKGRLEQKTLALPLERSNVEAMQSEDVTDWIHVDNMFDFENICYSKDHKNLPGGKRILTCAGCEKGVLGWALPIGEGPDMKMDSYLAPSRVLKK